MRLLDFAPLLYEELSIRSLIFLRLLLFRILKFWSFLGVAELLPQPSEYLVALEQIHHILSDDPFHSIEANPTLFADNL